MLLIVEAPAVTPETSRLNLVPRSEPGCGGAVRKAADNFAAESVPGMNLSSGVSQFLNANL